MITKKVYDKFRNFRSKYIILINRLIYGKRFSVSKGIYVRKGFLATIEEQGRINIGKGVFFNNDCTLNAMESITIGDSCIFGENVHIYDHNHIFDSKEIPVNDQGFTKKRVDIGKNCWIASNVTILKGVKIGDHCMIGANCVIHKDIPSDTLVKLNQQLISTSMAGESKL